MLITTTILKLNTTTYFKRILGVAKNDNEVIEIILYYK